MQMLNSMGLAPVEVLLCLEHMKRFQKSVGYTPFWTFFAFLAQTVFLCIHNGHTVPLNSFVLLRTPLTLLKHLGSSNKLAQTFVLHMQNAKQCHNYFA